MWPPSTSSNAGTRDAGTYSLQLVASSGLSSSRVGKQLKSLENANCKLPEAAGAAAKCACMQGARDGLLISSLSLVIMTVTHWKAISRLSRRHNSLLGLAEWTACPGC